MDKEEKIKAIYEKIADKTLSFGCKIYNPDSGLELKIFIDKKGYYHGYDNDGDLILFDIKIDDRFRIIIGHPVMIGDVLDYIGEKGYQYKADTGASWYILYKDDILIFWKIKRKPIEEQSDECIDHIYNLTLVGCITK